MQEGNEEKGNKNKCSPQDGFKLIVAGCVLFALSLTAGVIVDAFLKKGPTGHGGVASDSQACSNIGAEVLHSGGTAVDSAVATIICLAVTKPADMGLSRYKKILNLIPLFMHIMKEFVLSIFLSFFYTESTFPILFPFLCIIL